MTVLQYLFDENMRWAVGLRKVLEDMLKTVPPNKWDTDLILQRPLKFGEDRYIPYQRDLWRKRGWDLKETGKRNTPLQLKALNGDVENRPFSPNNVRREWERRAQIGSNYLVDLVGPIHPGDWTRVTVNLTRGEQKFREVPYDLLRALIWKLREEGWGVSLKNPVSHPHTEWPERWILILEPPKEELKDLINKHNLVST